MIILTTPAIANLNPSRQSSTINYGGCEFCLAEVSDFWWKLRESFIDTGNYDIRYKSAGGIIEGIDLLLNYGKECNIALAIYQISNLNGIDPFKLWEQSLK